MVLTLEHLLDLIDELPKRVNLDYVIAGTNKIQLDGVDYVEKYISATKVDTKKVLRKVPISQQKISVCL